MRRGMAATTWLGTLLLLGCAAFVAVHVVRTHESVRRHNAETLRQVDDILDDAGVRIRVSSRTEDLQAGLARYDEAFKLCPSREYVRGRMLDQASTLLSQTSQNGAIFYNARDLVNKMVELGFRDPAILSMREHIRYNLERGKEMWVLNLLAPVRSTPVVIGDNLFTVYQGSKVWALDPAKRSVWSELQDLVAPINSDLVAVREKILVLTLSGRMVAFNAADGSWAWQQTLADRLYDKPFVAADDARCYVLLSDGSMTALSMGDGSKLWSLPAGGPARGLLCSPAGVVAIFESALRVLDPSTGKTKWSQPLEKGPAYAALTPGCLAVAGGSSLVLWNLNDGTTMMTAALPAAVSAPILVWGDRIFVPLEDARVVAIGLVSPGGSGSIQWSLKLETEVGEGHSHDEHHHHDGDPPEKPKPKPGTKMVEVCRTAGAVAAGRLYVTGEETLYCINALTGELEWIYEGLAPVRTGLLVAGGRIIVGLEDPESKITFLKVIDTAIPSAGGWNQFGASSDRSFRAPN